MSNREAIAVRTHGPGTKRDARAIVSQVIGIGVGVFLGAARASTTDPQAHVMRNGEGGTVPSYNVQTTQMGLSHLRVSR